MPKASQTEHHVTRREVVSRGALAGAMTVAAPYFAVPGRSRAEEGEAKVPANDRIQVGVIGAGGQAGWHVETLLKEPGAEIVAICDVWKERLENKQSMCGGAPRGYEDYRELLQRSDIDAVLIATPPHWHALQAIHAVEAGKDIYLEKPMTLSLGEGFALLEAVHRHKRVSQIGTQIHATKNYRRLVDIVRSGRLGEITVGRTFHVLNDGLEGIGYPESDTVPKGLNWEMWMGPGPERPFNAKLVQGSYTHGSFMYSGGWTPGMAPHIVDLSIWALDLGLPTSASSSGGRYVVKDCGDAYDTHEVIWQYPGFTLTWHTSLINSYGFDNQGKPGTRRRRGIYLHGVNATLMGDYNMCKIFPEGDRTTVADVMKAPEVIPDSPGHHREWLQCIRTREQPSCHVGYHIRIDAAINLAMMSLKLGRSVQFDPETRKIVNDREAESLMVPEYRSPWKFPGEYLV